MAKSQEEVYFSNTSKKTCISKPILIPDDEFSDDTPKKSVAWKFLNEVKDTIVTLQRAVNQTDVRVIHFEKEFLKEAANFVRDYKSLAKEADESLEKITCLECENERLLKAVVECKYDKISYDKAYNEKQQKIKWLQAQLGDLKGKSMDTHCEIKSFDSVSHKLKDDNVSLEFQVLSLEKEIEHLKLVYQNIFDSIKQTRAQTKLKTDSLQEKLNDKIYENVNLRAQLQDKFSEQKVALEGVERPQPRNNTKNDRAPSVSKISCIKNNVVVVEEHQRNLSSFNNQKHMSSSSSICLMARATSSKSWLLHQRVYNQRTKKVMETMNVTFDELSAMDFEQRSSNPNFKVGLLDTSVQGSSLLMLSGQPLDATRNTPAAPETLNR
ncbi:hypothetical protein Tco_1269284 [Tanacetum coccineum]